MTETGFLDRTVRIGRVSLPYQVYVPREYDGGRAWPVILFLHGAGERGDDGRRQTTVGLGPFLRSDSGRFPAVAVLPQAPRGQSWSGQVLDGAIAALRQTQDELTTDPDRVYLTGISMGGNGVWNVAARSAAEFAALVPICGWVTRPERGSSNVHSALARSIGSVPTWIFHGADDEVIPVEESRAMHSALEQCGGNVRYTELAGVRHNSWDPAYARLELSAWLFAQRRGS